MVAKVQFTFHNFDYCVIGEMKEFSYQIWLIVAKINALFLIAKIKLVIKG